MESQPSKSPIKQEPLRQPGQYLDERFEQIMDGRFTGYVLASGFMIFYALMEWVHWVFKTPPAPVFTTILAIAVTAFSWWRLRKVLQDLRQLRRGSQGEKVVGQMLETLRADGYQVFHDIPCKSGDRKFNIDHVIVGPQGTFTIETKTKSKPMRGSVEVVFDGEKITANGWTPERDPVVQAKAEYKWLHDMLQNSTGRSFWIQPVILYPGWYVRENTQETSVWVLNPDRLRKKIQAQQKRLKPEDIALIADRIAVHVRSCDPH